MVVARATPAEIMAAIAALQAQAPALVEEWQQRTASNGHNGHGPGGKQIYSPPSAAEP